MFPTYKKFPPLILRATGFLFHWKFFWKNCVLTNYLFPIFHLLCRPLHSGSAPTAPPKTLSPRCPVPQVARSRECFWVPIWLGRSSEAPLRLLLHTKGNATQFVAKRTVSFLYCLIMFSPPLLLPGINQMLDEPNQSAFLLFISLVVYSALRVEFFKMYFIFSITIYSFYALFSCHSYHF